MKIRHPISAMLCVYNESGRIQGALDGLVPWADEVVVFDKGSTDATRELAVSVSPKVRVVSIPFSERGCEVHADLAPQARNAWVYWTTCSEVPTRRLVEAMDEVLSRQGDRVDLVRVPRRIVSLGTHSIHSPWAVSYYPFLFHRDRVVYSGIIHDHFRASAPGREAQIDYGPDVCVHHFAHPSFAAFVEMHKGYATHEGGIAQPGEYRRRLKEGLNTLLSSLCHTQPVQIHGMGHAIYNFMVCMKSFETRSGGPWTEHYRSWTRQILQQEWGVLPPSDSPVSSIGPITSAEDISLRCRIYKRLVRPLVSLLVWVACRNAPSSVEPEQRDS